MSDIIFSESTFLSANGHSNVHYYIWRPANVTPRAVIQLSHGMCEYVTRYDAWARRFCDAGYAFCGNDHLGHGNTAADEEELGFTAPRGGDVLLVEDLHTLTAIIKAEFEGLPVVLYGHSMGSFAARKYLTLYGDEVSAALISGTAGPGQPTAVAKRLANMIAATKGDHHRSKFLTSLAFGSYNRRFAEEKDALSWLTRDEAVRRAYGEDPFCRFVFTAAGYDTLFSLLHFVSRRAWSRALPRELPILLFAGRQDPVGNYGKGVEKVFDRMKEDGCNVRLCLYEGRHEMHNELGRDEVFSDICAYLEEVLV